MRILLLITLLFTQDIEPVEIKGLGSKNFKVAKRSGITIIEYWAAWNVANKITFLDSIIIEDANIYRVMIDTNMEIAASEKIIVVPTIIFYSDGHEESRLQADLTFKLIVTKKEIQKQVDEILMSKF